MPSIAYEGRNYTKVEEPPRGKKAAQVAGILKTMQSNPGIPIDFDQACMDVGLKYPQDVIAAGIALELTEFVDRYQLSTEVGHRAKTFYVWVGPEDDTWEEEEDAESDA